MSLQESKRFMIDFLAGGVAGIVSKTIAAPIQRVKLLLQTSRENTKLTHQYKGISDCFMRCVRQEGVISLWRGNGVNVIRYFPTQALNFSFKDYFSRLLQTKTDQKSAVKFMLNKILSGGLAGMTTTFFVHPLDFARTRLAVDLGKSAAQRQFTGLKSCLTKTFQSDGIRGLYRGLDVAVVSIFFYRGFYFGLYDISKKYFMNKDTNIFVKLMITQVCVMTAQIISYPGDTVKRKMMMQSHTKVRNYSGVMDCFSKIYRSEGLPGFWRGAYSNLLRGLGSAVCLILFDQMKKIGTTLSDKQS